MESKRELTMPKTAKAYIALVVLSGAAVLLFAASSWPATGLRQFVIYLGLAALASTLKVRIPGMEGTMSPNFVFLLLGMAACGFSQVVVISLAAALVQSLWAAKRPRLVQVAFSAATLMVSSAMAYKVSHLFLAANTGESSVPFVLLAGSLYFPLNSAMVSIVIGLVSGQPLRQAVLRCYEWVFRHFMGGIIFAGLVSSAYSASTAWRGALVLLPAVLLAYFYYVRRAARASSLQRSEVSAAD
jgi:hypothetical protein